MVLTTERYVAVRRALRELGAGADYDWAQSVAPPSTAEDLAREYAWVVINSGMRAAIAEKIWQRVREQLDSGKRAMFVFGHRGKARAIDEMWEERERRLTEFRGFGLTGSGARDGAAALAVIAWCESLPWIGQITKFHLAKNLGVDCAKPDRWLVRLAEVDGETVAELCARLSAATGDRIAAVDVVLWRACSLGLLVPGR